MKAQRKAEERKKNKAAKKNGKHKKNKAIHVPRAQREDRHALYEMSVQDTGSDVDFLIEAWHDVYGDEDAPLHFREDFCGTAAMCAEWVGRHPDATAEGYDIDTEVLDWGRRRHIEPLGDAAGRVALHEDDVRAAATRPADVRCAHNFSYQILDRRQELRDYFAKCLDGLSARGIFVLDIFGGSDALTEMEEEREIEEGDFTYVWEQRRFQPATQRMDCFIHFRFPDGSAMEEAFAYSWRLYSAPELRDLLLEVGFREVRTFFESFDEDGDGTGVFERDERGPDACEGWIGYMVAVP